VHRSRLYAYIAHDPTASRSRSTASSLARGSWAYSESSVEASLWPMYEATAVGAQPYSVAMTLAAECLSECQESRVPSGTTIPEAAMADSSARRRLRSSVIFPSLVEITKSSGEECSDFSFQAARILRASGTRGTSLSPASVFVVLSVLSGSAERETQIEFAIFSSSSRRSDHFSALTSPRRRPARPARARAARQRSFVPALTSLETVRRSRRAISFLLRCFGVSRPGEGVQRVPGDWHRASSVRGQLKEAAQDPAQVRDRPLAVARLRHLAEAEGDVVRADRLHLHVGQEVSVALPVVPPDISQFYGVVRPRSTEALGRRAHDQLAPPAPPPPPHPLRPPRRRPPSVPPDRRLPNLRQTPHRRGAVDALDVTACRLGWRQLIRPGRQVPQSD
jgi:hypothetical protein